MSFVIGAGATNIDLLYSGVSRLPRAGEEVYCSDFSLQLGGGIPATLINLSRLGIKTKIVTELGDDMFSRFAAEQYIKSGAEPINVYRRSGFAPNVTSVIVLPQDRSFVTYGKSSFDPDDYAKEEFYRQARGAKIVLLQPGGFIDVYRRLKDEGCVTVLDMGWDDEMSEEKYSSLLALADYYTPNRAEAMKLTGESDPFKAAERLKRYFKRVVVKTDKDGCIGIDEHGEMFTVPSVNDFKRVDSTGAGDAFLSGFVYGLYRGYSFRQAILLGNLTGGKAVTAVGALSAYFTKNELLERFDYYSKLLNQE